MKRWLVGLLLLVLAGVLLVIVINVINSNRDPVAVLKKFGAKIKRNEQGEVVEVSLSYAKITNPGRVQQLLNELGYDSTKITDADLVRLKEFAELQTLFPIGNDKITDAGLVHLRGLTGLQTLELSNTKVTDAGVADL
jgi:hypothetical protein